MTSDVESTDGRVAFGLTVAGLVTALAAFVVLWQVPLSTTTSIRGTTSQTLAEAEGSHILVIAALPTIIAVVVWLGLHARCARGSRLGTVAATAAVTVLGLLTLLGMFSIGLFLLPAAALLICAVAMTPRGHPAS